MKKNSISLITLLLILSCYNLNGQYSWIQKANFPGMVRAQSASFSIGNKGYITSGCSFPNNQTYNDHWEYDAVLNTWTQKASLNSFARFAAVGFAIGNYGYVGCGGTIPVGGTLLKDFERYDPVNNIWTNIPDLPANPRMLGIGVSDGAKGYVGLGYAPLLSDMYCYDPAINSWNVIQAFPGGARQAASTFCISGIIYVCGGSTTSATYHDIWAYSPATNSWTQKTPFPGIARTGAVAFALNGYGFLGSGYNYPTPYDNEFYMFDPINNSWTTSTAWPTTNRQTSASFVINNTAYVGCGVFSQPTQCYNDFWSFALNNGFEELNQNSYFSSYYDNASQNIIIDFRDKLSSDQNKIEIFDISGKLVYSKKAEGNQYKTMIDGSRFSNGTYLVKVNLSVRKIVKM